MTGKTVSHTVELSGEAAERLLAAKRFWDGPEGVGLKRLRDVLRTAEADPVIAHSSAAAGFICIFELLIEDASAESLAAGRLFGLLEDIFGTEAVSKLQAARAEKKHQNNRRATARIPALWEQFKAQGKSKNEAAPLIAAEVNLTAAVVRKKLQGK